MWLRREVQWRCVARDKSGLSHRGWTRLAPWIGSTGLLHCGCCNDYWDTVVGCGSRTRLVWRWGGRGL
jgi:hypothetical protein